MDEKQQKIKWIKTWQTAAVALEDIKRKELQAPDYYEKNRVFLDEMLQYACENAEPRLSSGLVEQQRLFKKMYEKQKAKERL